jgi:hypothetical protein
MKHLLKRMPGHIDLAIRYGDWEFLARCLEQDVEITPELRIYLAKVLRRKVKRPNRPRRIETDHRQSDIASTVGFFMCKGKKVEAAKAEAMEWHGASKSAVDRAWKEHRARVMRTVARVSVTKGGAS